MPRTDYDLYVSDYRAALGTNGGKALASGFSQAAGAVPIEANDMRWLCNTNAAAGPVYDGNRDGYVSLWVLRTTRNTASPVGDVLEIMVNSGWLEHSSSAGSAAIPFGDSRNAGAASVGAYRMQSAIEAYSARGPTNDGRAKPDLVAQSCVQTAVDGYDSQCQTNGFAGTSAAAPQVAGMVAVGVGAFGFTRPSDMVNWVRSYAYPEAGFIGFGAKSNTVGWGFPNRPAPPAVPARGVGFTSVPPLRVLDTRGVNGQQLGAPIGLRAPDSIVMLATGHQPGDSIVLNVTLVNAVSPGFLQVYSFGSGAPGATSSLNATAVGQNRANLVVVTVGDQGLVGLYTSGGGHILVDVVGLFLKYGSTPPLTFLEPYEAFDSATCASCSGAPVSGNSYIDVPLVGTTASFDPEIGVPAEVNGTPPAAVAISVTVRDPSDRGYLSVVAADSTVFGTSNMNFDKGETLTVTTFAPVSTSTNGVTRIFVSKSAHVRVEVLGYFGSVEWGQTSGYFTGVPTVRVLDTRSGARPAAG
ncbi:MAG: S8 family serine peptidase, partial [Actinomycetota bacterium]|nr:S8 family serine peptidase [Actinomycetota bacterium]